MGKREPGVGEAGAPDQNVMFTVAGQRFAGAGRRSAGPDARPALLIATAAAAAVGVTAVLLRHLKLSLEAGFADGRQIGEVLGWAVLGVALAAAGLWFGYAPRAGLKLRGAHMLVLTALAVGATALVAAWIGMPTPAQRLDYRVALIAAQARDDSLTDIKSQARALQWTPRLAPGSIEKEKDLPALRKVIADTDDVINDYKIRLAKRRQNIRTLLDVAAPTVQDRVHVQELYDRLVGDLAAKEDRYWDLQAQAVAEGCGLVDKVAYLRGWLEMKARGYPVRIDQHIFDQQYAAAWQKLSDLKGDINDTRKAVETLPPAVPRQSPPGGGGASRPDIA